MADNVAKIRRYTAEDHKAVKFVVGKANFDSLAVANHKVCTNPVMITVWVALSSIFVEYMHWWPSSHPGPLGYLKMLPAFASMAVPLMFLVDWINRPYFEKITQDVLKRPDMQDLSNYYSDSSASGLWILEYRGLIVGLIALDAHPDAPPSGSKNSKKHKEPPNKPHTGLIRHFYVDELYRKAGVQKDLLVHAIEYAFKADSTLERIRAPDSPLVPYIRDCLKTSGFELEEYTEKVGILGWKLGMRVLNRKDWNGEQSTDT